MIKIEKSVLQTWWVVFFLLGCLLFFERGEKGREDQYAVLSGKLRDLEREQQAALKVREDLLLQMNSQSDPGYVELILMKELGVVAEGQQKIYFSDTWN